MAGVDPGYELVEARSEISRHHKLIAELREGLEWALATIAFLDEGTQPMSLLMSDDKEKADYYWRILNRQVS